jgi:hypothetical protein
MIRRAIPVAGALSALVLAAGCGSGGGSNAAGTTGGVAGTTASVAGTTAGTTVTVGIKPACDRLDTVTQNAVKEIGTTLSGFTGVRSLGQLSHHVSTLQGQLRSASARVSAVDTPPGPITRDKRRVSAAFSQLEHRIATARSEAEAGHAGTAARQFASLAQLTGVRHAGASLARDCPKG